MIGEERVRTRDTSHRFARARGALLGRGEAVGVALSTARGLRAARNDPTAMNFAVGSWLKGRSKKFGAKSGSLLARGHGLGVAQACGGMVQDLRRLDVRREAGARRGEGTRGQ